MCVVAIVVPHGDIHAQCHRFSLGLRLHLKHSRHSIARISSISRLNLVNKSAFCQKHVSVAKGELFRCFENVQYLLLKELSLVDYSHSLDTYDGGLFLI